MNIMGNRENRIQDLFRHLLKVRMGLRQVIMRELRGEGVEINFETLQVLNRVRQTPGITQQGLAEMTVRDKSSITSLVNKLERGGLVTRTGDEEDRRNKRLYLSEEGERLAETFKPVIDRVYEDIHSRMGCEKETELCIGYLNRMYEVLESM